MSAVRLARRLWRRVSWRPKCTACYHLRCTVIDYEADQDYAGAALAEGRYRAHRRDDHPESARQVSP